MACLPTYLRTKYLADLAIIQDQISKLQTVLSSAIQNGEVEEYVFNSGEGSQKTVRRSLKELNNLLIDLKAQEDRIYRKLYGRSVINVNLRRKRYNGYR